MSEGSVDNCSRLITVCLPSLGNVTHEIIMNIYSSQSIVTLSRHVPLCGCLNSVILKRPLLGLMIHWLGGWWLVGLLVDRMVVVACRALCVPVANTY